MNLRLAIVAAALAAAPLAARAQTKPRSLTDTLVQLETKSWDAWKARDSSFYRTFLSDDHVEVGFSGTAGKADVLATVATPHCVVTKYSVEQFHLTKFDANTALLTYHASQQTTCSGKPVPSPVWVSSLYVRRGGRWQNAAYQQSQDATAKK